MKTSGFDLFSKHHPEYGIAIKRARILELRAAARTYLEKHNLLVGQLWDVEQKLEQIEDEDVKSLLIGEKTDLFAQIENAGYIKQINALREEIKALEIDLYGSSEIDSNSPYQL